MRLGNSALEVRRSLLRFLCCASRFLFPWLFPPRRCLITLIHNNPRVAYTSAFSPFPIVDDECERMEYGDAGRRRLFFSLGAPSAITGRGKGWLKRTADDATKRFSRAAFKKLFFIAVLVYNVHSVQCTCCKNC